MSFKPMYTYTHSPIHLKKTGGFTLLEIMLTMVLLAIILGALYSSFFLSEKALNGLDDSILKLQESRKTADIMGREVESLFYDSSDKNCIFRIADRDFYGKQASSFSFTAYSPLIQGLAAISYYVEEKDGKMTLYKKINSYLQPAQPDSEVEIIEDIDSFMVEAAQNGAQWTKTWDAAVTGSIPDQIRITFTILAKGKPVTLYETLTPMIGKSL